MIKVMSSLHQRKISERNRGNPSQNILSWISTAVRANSICEFRRRSTGSAIWAAVNSRVWPSPTSPDEGGPEPKTAEKETWYHEERDYIIADELPFRQDGMGITNGMRYRVFVYDRKEDTLNAVSDKWQNVESINAKMGRSSSAREDFKKRNPICFTATWRFMTPVPEFWMF